MSLDSMVGFSPEVAVMIDGNHVMLTTDEGCDGGVLLNPRVPLTTSPPAIPQQQPFYPSPIFAVAMLHTFDNHHAVLSSSSHSSARKTHHDDEDDDIIDREKLSSYVRVFFDATSTFLIIAERHRIYAYSLVPLLEGRPPHLVWKLEWRDVIVKRSGGSNSSISREENITPSHVLPNDNALHLCCWTTCDMMSDNSLVAAGCSDGVVHVWRTSEIVSHSKRGEPIGLQATTVLLPPPLVTVAAYHSHTSPYSQFPAPMMTRAAVSAVMFSPAVYDEQEPQQRHPALLVVAFSDGSIVLRDEANHWDCSAALRGHTATINCVVFSSDCSLLVSCSDDCTLRLWAVSSGACVGVVPQSTIPRCVAIDTDCSLLALGSDDGRATVFHLHNGTVAAQIEGHHGGDGRLPSSSNYRGSAATSSRHTTTATSTSSSDSKVVPNDAMKPSHHSITSITFSPCMMRILTGSRNGSAKMWQLPMECINAGKHPTSTTATSSSSSGIENAKCIHTVTAHVGAVTSVAFSNSGRFFASASEGGIAHLWWLHEPPRPRQLLATLIEHTEDVTCAALSSNCQLLFTCGKDKSAKLWAVKSGQCILTVGVPSTPVRVVCNVTDYELTLECWSDWSFASPSAMMTLKLPTTIVAEMIKAARTCGDASPLLSRKNTPVALVGLPQPRSSHFDPHVAPPLILKAEVRPPSIQAVMLSEITYRKESFASGATALLHVVDAVPDFITKSTTVTKFVAKLYHANVTRQNVEEALSVVPILQHPNIVRVVAVIRGRPLAKEEEEEEEAGEGSAISQEQNKINEDVHHSSKDAFNSSAPICGLLMERCIRTLAQELRSLSPPPISARLQWLYEVARAIYFAHCSGVNHSDISPTKVLLVADKDDRKIAKLSDFGSAYVMQTLHTNSKTNDVKGALERSLFMAPEYASGEPLTQACDVFSFGMTMWSVLYPGKDHGLGSSLVRIALSLKCNKRPPLTPLATWDSKPILDLISECWATEPDERPRMEKVLAVLQQCLESSATSTAVASHELWHQYLGQSLEFVKAFDTLNWNEREPPQSTATAMAVRKQVLFSEPITEFFHPCHAFVRRCLGAKFNVGAVTKIVMVYPRTHVTSFIAVHNAENHSRLMNSALRLENPPNPDYEAAVHRLKSVFIPSPAVKNENAKARIFFAWHGTEVSAVDRVCEDGPRSLSTTDSGFFGSGSYFALEAWYASRFSKPSPAHDNERCLILFAVSISQAYVVTLDGDYKDERATDQTPPIPEVQTGWSRFYIGNDVRGRGMALAPKCDAHFIPVKYYGHVHPLTKVPLQHDVDYQAASESEATAHEIVIGSHHRCVPLAVVYFRT